MLWSPASFRRVDYTQQSRCLKFSTRSGHNGETTYMYVRISPFSSGPPAQTKPPQFIAPNFSRTSLSHPPIACAELVVHITSRSTQKGDGRTQAIRQALLRQFLVPKRAGSLAPGCASAHASRMVHVERGEESAMPWRHPPVSRRCRICSQRKMRPPRPPYRGRLNIHPDIRPRHLCGGSSEVAEHREREWQFQVLVCVSTSCRNAL